MSQSIKLSEVQIEKIRKLARNIRESLGFIGETPIANDIFTILDKKDIILIEYPIKAENNKTVTNYEENSLENKINSIGLYSENGLNLFA